MALQHAQDVGLAGQKLRFLCVANADRKGGRASTGVRGWIVYCVYGLGVSPIPDPFDGHRREVECRLEDFARHGAQGDGGGGPQPRGVRRPLAAHRRGNRGARTQLTSRLA